MLATAQQFAGKAQASRKNTADARGRLLRDLRLSVIDRCNLRCQYCLPESLFGENFRFKSLNELLSFDELERVANAFIGLGVEKIRLTGGEPLLRPGIADFVARLREQNPDVDLALTTNALRLKRMAKELHDAGLDRVNISLDAINPDAAERMAGRPFSPQDVLDAAETAREVGLGVKLNAVIKRGVNDGEILPLAQAARDRGMVLRYIEYMDVGSSNGWSRDDVITGQEIRERLGTISELTPEKPVTYGEVARRYRYADNGLEVGFIESISRPFCGDCTRARVSAEGELFTCLFATKGIPLRAAIQREDFPALLRDIWLHRKDNYSETRQLTPRTNAQDVPEEMWRLGG
ncbi:GTP 3',8-cyclase MoaA [Cerasicoccus fimbriatus]|uniref:GTP 3',8-cyclase MoaA n=1 Tax=Cerasicoccus fimbriatus TaxID=3014554 RepID=UPI0022B3ADA0|nr:GTP 3',8-cyclase MoaA [Cerasicoccus sp. TK19100]